MLAATLRLLLLSPKSSPFSLSLSLSLSLFLLSLRVYSCTSSSSSSSSSLAFVRSFLAVTSYLTPSFLRPPLLSPPPTTSPRRRAYERFSRATHSEQNNSEGRNGTAQQKTTADHKQHRGRRRRPAGQWKQTAEAAFGDARVFRVFFPPPFFPGFGQVSLKCVRVGSSSVPPGTCFVLQVKSMVRKGEKNTTPAKWNQQMQKKERNRQTCLLAGWLVGWGPHHVINRSSW